MQPTAPYPPFSVTVKHSGATDHIIVSGELDRATGPQLTATLESRFSARRHVVLDLSALTFIDIGGVRVVCALAREAERRHCRLDIRAGRVGAEMFELVGIDPRLPGAGDGDGDGDGTKRCRPRHAQRVTRLRAMRVCD
jgi:anti-anti-sigma factor